VAADHQIYVYVDGVLAVSGTDDTRLAAGASQGWYWETQWPSDNATHTFNVVVDATNLVAESNENNNSASISASVISSPDFSISPLPSSQTVTQRDSTIYMVTLASQNGFNSPVSLSASSLPYGATYTFNPSSLTPTGSSALTISTSTSTPVGSYTITITATGGGKTHTTTVTLNIQPASSDLNMHITSPTEGVTITTATFNVSGTFDSAPETNNFRLFVTVGTESYTYNFTASGLTWGPVIVNMADFTSITGGTAYTVTLLAQSQSPTIPPYQTGIRNITWLFEAPPLPTFTLYIPSGWSLISVPFDTDASLLSCPLIYYFNGSTWLPETATLHPGRGYLVLSTTPASRDVILTGTPLSSPFSLPSPGSWQLIGNPFASPCTLSSTSPILLIYFFNSTTSTWQPADINNLQPGMGYLVLTSSSGTFTFTMNP
jgi:hypothetical protein